MPSFLPVTLEELKQKGIQQPDIVLVTGDAYIDSPYCGVAVVGRVLEDAGYSVAVIPQPDVQSPEDITSLGEPRLFWGITSGCVDSEVANYTALGKPRQQCDFTPGGKNSRRPDRACIAYSNLVRRHFKNTVPLVLGGLEASLRRIAHYDWRTDRVRRSILLDAKADILVYGMGEKAVLEIAHALDHSRGLDNIPGTCVAAKSSPENYLELPSFESVKRDPQAFASMFKKFYLRAASGSSQGMIQLHQDRYLVHHPPQPYTNSRELDHIHELPFLDQAHPWCSRQGQIRALETIQESIVSHRGCFGGCSFCSIALHQGRSTVSRSKASIVREARRMAEKKEFSGVIKDVGGPTANMYGTGCKRLDRGKPCPDKECLGYEGICPELRLAHKQQKNLLDELERIPGVKRVYVSSGIRHDLILADKTHGPGYLRQLIRRHIPGQMKIAPEHSSERVLRLMNKPSVSVTSEFARMYRELASKEGKNIYLSCYVIAAHPGSTRKDMQEFARFARSNLKFLPRQVQIFTPLPSTRSTVMYHCGMDPFTGEKIFCEKTLKGKKRQKDILTESQPPSGIRKPRSST